MTATPAATSVSPAESDLAQELAGDVTRAVRRSGMIAASLLAVLAAVAVFVPIASGTLAMGQLAVEGQRKVVQHPTGGVVTDILVKEGDLVAAGDIVLRLNAVEAGAAAGVVNTQVDALMAEEAVRMAEITDKPEVTFPAELLNRRADPRVEAVITTETAAFEARRAQARSQREQLSQQLKQTEESIVAAASQRAAQDAQAVLLQEELEALEPLLEKGLALKSRVLAVERSLEAAKGQIDALDAERRRLVARREETKSLLARIDIDRRAEASEALRRVRADLAAALERQLATSDTLARTEVRAPTSGVVMALAVSTVGGVVEPGAALMEIVPQSERLIVRARISPREADNVHQGLPATIRLSAGGGRSPASVDGRVQSVSADALNDPRTGEAYFEVRIAISPEEMAKAPADLAAPGLPAEVLIRTGSHTMLDYFFSPVERVVFRSMRDV